MSFLINPFILAQAGVTLTAEAGTFALTGNAAAFKRALRMSAAVGAFTLTGNDAALSSGIRMQAAAGAFTLTGNAAGLKRALKLAAAAGTFSLTGNAASLAYSSTRFYALAHKSADQTATSGNVAFGAEVHDTAGIHDNTTNNSRFTVPSSWNGRYARFSGNIASSAELSISATLSGSSFAGAGRSDGSPTDGDDAAFMICAPVTVSTGQYFEMTFVGGASTTLYNNVATWGQLELMPPDFNGAVVQKTGSQSISAGTTTALTWDTELYDLDTWHDNSTNNSRLTVPSGVSLVRLSTSMKGGNVTGQLVASMLKNGSSARGLPQADCDTGTEDAISVVSAPLAVSSGDYFEAQIFTTSATSVPNADDVWFAIEELPSDLKYALVNRSSNQAISAGVTTTIDWNAEVADTDTWHDNSTNPSRLTVPSGVARVRVTANLITEASATSQFILSMLKNGSTFIGGARSETDTAGTDSVNGMSAIIDVTAGDYFEARVFATSNINIGASVQTWFSIEEVRATG